MAFTKILPAGISTTGTVTLERVETTNSIVSLGSTNQLYINTDTPTVRPTLDLNFERDQRLDSRITFSRDSTATYLGSDGLIKTALAGEPRFEFDTDGNCLGLLIEESRTNLHLHSENLSSWYVETGGSVGVNTTSTVAPDGNQTADSLFGTLNGSSAYTIISFSNATTYTFSVFLKYLTGNENIRIEIGDAPFARSSTTFNTVTGALVSNTGGTATVNEVESYGNGWYRYSITRTTTSAGGGFMDINHVSTTSSSVAVWGAQVESGSFATSYIPTTTATVTRSADFAKITGTNFTDFYNQTEGTIFFRYKNLSLDTSTIRGVWGLENSSAPVSGVRSPQSGSLRIRLLYNTNFSPAESNLFLISTDYQNGIVSYNQTENRLMMNGTSDFVSATHTNDNDIIAMSIGSRTTNGDSPLGGHISHLTYYPQRLSNAQLQNLTS